MWKTFFYDWFGKFLIDLFLKEDRGGSRAMEFCYFCCLEFRTLRYIKVFEVYSLNQYNLINCNLNKYNQSLNTSSILAPKMNIYNPRVLILMILSCWIFKMLEVVNSKMNQTRKYLLTTITDAQTTCHLKKWQQSVDVDTFRWWLNQKSCILSWRNNSK